MSWSEQQQAALKAVSKWVKDPTAKQIFTLFGYAGTGKTTLAKEIAASIPGVVLFGAFTGKASLVLRSKGCTGASTIHSMIYKPPEDDDANPTFVLNEDSDVRTASLVIIDECSMVDEELGRDLISFGTKILVLGDPMQLPPIKGQGFFNTRSPDVMLTEIHRQAADNPIIRMSLDVREGRGLTAGQYGDSKVIRRDQLAQADVLNADQVLVGRNRTRRNYNARIRQLKGFEGIFPQINDRLVCLRNKKDKQLLNGGIWTVKNVKMDAKSVVNMHVASNDDPSVKLPVEVDVPVEFFKGTEESLNWRIRREMEEFDYGYALTVHKAQGSQWATVMLFDESSAFPDTRRNHLYTALTRAADRVTVVI
ncbi:AAA ATPase [Caballeronia pedi]|uniref:AAA ATPase n=1 Tax=Caballeronia pedi TaxID=1777141 RepID=A0A158DVF0_9BURK|nr:AAA family ATPase [Caballeronia pedi]SAK98534.1 AAA ATPase [Caballeronia pedi]